MHGDGDGLGGGKTVEVERFGLCRMLGLIIVVTLLPYNDSMVQLFSSSVKYFITFDEFPHRFGATIVKRYPSLSINSIYT